MGKPKVNQSARYLAANGLQTRYMPDGKMWFKTMDFDSAKREVSEMVWKRPDWVERRVQPCTAGSRWLPIAWRHAGHCSCHRPPALCPWNQTPPFPKHSSHMPSSCPHLLTVNTPNHVSLDTIMFCSKQCNNVIIFWLLFMRVQHSLQEMGLCDTATPSDALF